MKKITLLFVLLLVTISPTLAQDDAITWELVSDEPISAYGERGTWNSTYNEPGAVIYYEEQYHLFVNGYAGFPANTGIGYRVSDDGLDYEWAHDGPLFSRDDAPGDPVAIAVTDVLVLDDGTWVLYFYNFNSSNWPHVEGTIGRAIADDPLGPWTIDEDPVLSPGEEDSWDEQSITFASVVQVEDGFVMYYIGEDALNTERLGRATSDDGITWVKDAEPVFEFDTSIGESPTFVVNEVIFDGERWILAYKSQRHAVGFAFSEDGIAWERYADNPVFSSTDLDGISTIGYISFAVNDDGAYTLFFEGGTGSRTQVYAANITLPE
jgi:predicted GH43/DUF377 family glycosyl hydrolase